MHLKYTFSLAAVLAFIATLPLNVDAARRIKLRPLSAREVRRILKAAGREDAIPEGRVVTQGIAAITGFALGLTKGIGGSLLLDLATSNATSEFINNFNYTAMMGDFQGLNMTALMEMLKGSSAANSNRITYQTTEICFETTAAEPTRLMRGKSKGYDNDFDYYEDEIEMPRQADVSSPSLDAADGATDSATGTSIDTGTLTDTKTNTVTQAEGGGNGQTCIVIQKPKLRKRRSMRGHRRRSALVF